MRPAPEPPIAVDWGPRLCPLEPRAAVAEGAAARALARAGARHRHLRALAGADILVLLGAADDLPWIDGVCYLGRDPCAPALFLPTMLAPSVPATLLERALRAALPGLTPPLALLGYRRAIVSLAAARPVTAAELLAWADGAGG